MILPRLKLADAAAMEMRRLAEEVREEAARLMPRSRLQRRRAPIRVVVQQGEPIRDRRLAIEAAQP